MVKDTKLNLDLHPEEEVWMAQVGHLNKWCPNTNSINLTATPSIQNNTLTRSIQLLFMFKHLQSLILNFASLKSKLVQGTLQAFAEIFHLSSLCIKGGNLEIDSLDFIVLTSLKNLKHLSVEPAADVGFSDIHLEGLASLTTLESLAFKGDEDSLSDDGLCHLTALSNLTSLSILPVGLMCSRESIMTFSSLKALQKLSLGLQDSRQIAVLRGFDFAPQISITCADSLIVPEPFLAHCSLCLQTNLVSLRLHSIPTADRDYLISIGTLHNLTELYLSTYLSPGADAYIANLGLLSSLHRLHAVEFYASQEILLPLTLKLVSCLSHSWPGLKSLALSAAGRSEVRPDALEALAMFPALSRLALSAPILSPVETTYSVSQTNASLEKLYQPSSELQRILINQLPESISHLSLEQALLCLPTPLSSSKRPISTSEAGRKEDIQASHCLESQLSFSESSAGSFMTRTEELPHAPHENFLPHLIKLELSECRIEERIISGIITSAPKLVHLELLEVECVSNASLAPLQALTGLTRLVVLAAPVHGVHTKPSPQTPLNISCVASLPSSLRYLELELSPLPAATQVDRQVPILRTLSSLVYVIIVTAQSAKKSQDEHVLSTPSWVSAMQSALPAAYVSGTLPSRVEDCWQFSESCAAE